MDIICLIGAGSSTRMNILILFLFLYLTSQPARLQNDTQVLPINNEMTDNRCEVLTIQSCSDVGYTMASFPNFRGHTSQSEAEDELAQFLPLVATSCSSSIMQFLCGYYAPFCVTPSVSDDPITIKPCRSLCESFRAGCEAELQKARLPWPPFFNCSLQAFAESPLCFGPTASPPVVTIAMVPVPTLSPTSTSTTAVLSQGNMTLPPIDIQPMVVSGSRRIMALFHIMLIPSLLTLI